MCQDFVDDHVADRACSLRTGSAAEFVTRPPITAFRVINIRIGDFETRAIAVRATRPGTSVVVFKLLDDIAFCVQQREEFSTVAQPSRKDSGSLRHVVLFRKPNR